MTEAEWEESTDVGPMSAALGRSPSQRKVRLFACECCRRVEWLFRHHGSRDAMTVGEQYIEGTASAAQLRAACGRAGAAVERLSAEAAVSTRLIAAAARDAAVVAVESARKQVNIWAVANTCIRTFAATSAKTPNLPALLRDIFGNPFRLVAFRPEWRSGTAVSLASTMYAARDFGAMPVLADALEDAGCDDPPVLAHCRGGGPHVRGCWVVDGVLGKS